jgi:hypothetical protein
VAVPVGPRRGMVQHSAQRALAVHVLAVHVQWRHGGPGGFELHAACE